jgi:hypothetical protein
MPEDKLKDSMEELKGIKELIDTKKEDKARVEGRIQSLEEQLESFGQKSVIKAKKEIRALTKEVEGIDIELADNLVELKRKMDEGNI